MPEKSSIKPFDGFNTFINVLMGTGPILLPPAIAAAGIGLSSVWLVIMFFLSQMAAEFIIETLAIVNAIKRVNYTPEEDQQQQPLTLTNHYSLGSQGVIETFESPSEAFELRETFEFGMMGDYLWGRTGQIVNSLNIIIYLYGIMISKGIITGSTLSTLFTGITVLDQPTFWVIIFYLISGSLSFQNIAAISIVQTLIALIRYATIIIMFVGAFMVIGDHGQQKIKYWDFSEFPNLFSTAVFAFMAHHSIPGMMRPIKPSTSIKPILNIGFGVAGILFFLIPLSGMKAFPGLSDYCYYNIIYDQKPVIFAYYFISFYIFLNIAALPVLTITMRTNTMRLFAPHLIPANPLRVTWPTVGFTMIITFPCMLLAILLVNQIEFVVGITGGVCGTIIMMVLPAMMVMTARKMSPVPPVHNPNKSIYYSNIFPILSLVIAAVVLPYNLYLQVDQLVEQLEGKSTVCLHHFNSTITSYSN